MLLNSTNNGEDGNVYIMPDIALNLLQFVETATTLFQKNQLSIERKFVLNTADGSPKRDLLLTKAAMPKPVAFVAGKYQIDGVLLPSPELWSTRNASSGDENFDVAVDLSSLEDL